MEKMQKHNFRESKHFDSLIDKYGEGWWGNTTEAGIERQRRRAKMFSQLVSCYNNPKVLEIGCGTGIFSKYILEEFPLRRFRFIGCDISQKAVAIARQKCARYQNTHFVTTDVVSLPYKGGYFDAVVGNAILHHLPLELSLRECRRVLKPGGIIWFTEPNMINPQIMIEKNIRSIGKLLQNTEAEVAFFRWSLVKKLQDAGFQNIVVQPFDFLHPIVPRFLIKPVNKIGQLLERLVIVKEIAGSLLIIGKN